MPSPANTSTSSGPGSNHSGSGLVVDPVSSAVAVPQAIEKVAFTYVNITTLVLSAYDIWEQAEELAHKGSGKNPFTGLQLAAVFSSTLVMTKKSMLELKHKNEF